MYICSTNSLIYIVTVLLCIIKILYLFNLSQSYIYFMWAKHQQQNEYRLCTLTRVIIIELWWCFFFVTLLIILSDTVLNACTTSCMQCEDVCLWLSLGRGRLGGMLWNFRWRAARTPGGPKVISAACRQMRPGSSQLEVLIPTTETDLHTELRPPFITAESWLGRVTRWDCACHPGHTLCQLKLFFISWMIDSSLIVLLLFFPSSCEAWTWTWERVDLAAAVFERKKVLQSGFAGFLMICRQLRSIYGFKWTCYI